MSRRFIRIFPVFIVAALVIYVIAAGPAFGQVYFEDDFSSPASLDNWEIGGNATWQVENGELVTLDAGGDWNVIVVKEALWQGWTDYTYELTVTPEPGSSFIYQVFRYAQPVSADRTNFFSYLMDQDNAKIHIDRFVNGTRTRGTDDLAVTVTMDGAWVNAGTHTAKIEVTATTISGYMDGQKQFGPIQESNNADGRIGIGVWAATGHFDDVMVYGPDGVTAVSPSDKVANTWGRIKAEIK